MRSAKPLDGLDPVTKPVAEVVVPFDDTEFLPSDVLIRYRDGSTQAVSSIDSFPHAIYKDMTVFMGRFRGTDDAEFVVSITLANSLIEKIARRGKRGASDV